MDNKTKILKLSSENKKLKAELKQIKEVLELDQRIKEETSGMSERELKAYWDSWAGMG